MNKTSPPPLPQIALILSWMALRALLWNRMDRFSVTYKRLNKNKKAVKANLKQTLSIAANTVTTVK